MIVQTGIMAIGRVTKKAVEAMPIPVSGKRAFLWDDQLKGFGVSGARTAAGDGADCERYQDREL